MKIDIFTPLIIYELGHRNNQEDAIAQWDNRLFVLCDGMGGHEKGEVASQTVCQSLVKWFRENIKDDSFTDEQLRESLEYTYTELDKYDDGSPRKMGSTLTLLYIHNKGVTAAHIGDSRIYHVRPNVGMLYQSRDHSLVFDLLLAGEISYDEMATFPQKNVITRAMQPSEENRMRPDIVHITDVLPGDYFYMCSDGMLEQMTNEELIVLFSSDATNEEKQKQLIEATVNNQDNHSAWLVQIKDVIKEDDNEELENEEPTSRCNAINIIPNIIASSENNDVRVIEQSTGTNAIRFDLYKKGHKRKSIMKPFIFLLILIAALIALIVLAVFASFKLQQEESTERKTLSHTIGKMDVNASKSEFTINVKS